MLSYKVRYMHAYNLGNVFKKIFKKYGGAKSRGWSNSAKHDKLALLLREECDPVLFGKLESLKKT